MNEQTANQDTEVRIVGGDSQTWEDFQAGGEQEEEKAAWRFAGTLGLVSQPREVGRYAEAVNRWWSNQGNDNLPPVRLVTELSYLGTQDRGYSLHDATVLLEPRVGSVTIGNLKEMVQQVQATLGQTEEQI